MAAKATPTYTSIVLTKYSEVDDSSSLEVRRETEALDAPGTSQVLVRVLAASASFTDVMIRRGLYPDLPGKPPFVIGYDLVGEVLARGDGVREELTVGARVSALTVVGGCAQYALLDAEHLVVVPDGVETNAAAGAILGWLTAYQMLTRSGFEAGEGKTVLVHSASGSVGSALVVLAKSMGCTVFGTASASKHGFCSELGIDACFDYTADDVARRVADLGGVDAVFDGVSLASFKTSFKMLKSDPAGVLIPYGFYTASRGKSKGKLAGEFIKFMLWSKFKNKFSSKTITPLFNVVTLRSKEPEAFRADLTHIFSLIASGVVTPHVHVVMPLEQVQEAHTAITGGSVRGKIVLDPWPNGYDR
ncbi:Zn-dependent oxidoreductase, partial [Thecamonas trahens ATCC 50062]